MTLFMLAAATVSGQLVARIGRYRPFPIAGAVAVFAGMVLLSRFGTDTTYGFQLLALAAVGVGFGLINPIMVLAAQNAVGPRDIGVASSTVAFCRSVGGAFGVAIFGSIFTTRLTGLLARLPSGDSAGGLLAVRAQVAGLSGRAQFVDAAAAALRDVFVAGVAVAVIDVVLSLCLRPDHVE